MSDVLDFILVIAVLAPIGAYAVNYQGFRDWVNSQLKIGGNGGGGGGVGGLTDAQKTSLIILTVYIFCKTHPTGTYTNQALLTLTNRIVACCMTQINQGASIISSGASDSQKLAQFITVAKTIAGKLKISTANFSGPATKCATCSNCG